MEEKNKVISFKAFENMKRYKEREENLKESKEIIFNTYKSDIKGYVNHCKETEQEENETSYLDYLYVSVAKRKKLGIRILWWKRAISLPFQIS